MTLSLWDIKLPVQPLFFGTKSCGLNKKHAISFVIKIKKSLKIIYELLPTFPKNVKTTKSQNRYKKSAFV
jgi:hypothetical protein